MPPEARWDPLLAESNQPDIGERLDAALDAVERANEEQLRGVLPRVYARAPIEAQKLGELVTTIADHVIERAVRPAASPRLYNF